VEELAGPNESEWQDMCHSVSGWRHLIALHSKLQWRWNISKKWKVNMMMYSGEEIYRMFLPEQKVSPTEISQNLQNNVWCVVSTTQEHATYNWDVTLQVDEHLSPTIQIFLRQHTKHII
jgi:hypothetical protein